MVEMFEAQQKKLDELEKQLNPEPEKKTVKNLFSSPVKLRSKHTSTQFSFRTIIWALAILAIPAYGLYAMNYHPAQHQVTPITPTVTPFGLLGIRPTETPKPPTSTPTITPTNLPTNTPTFTPTITDTPFISELYVSIQTLYPKIDSITTSGVKWKSVLNFGLGCPTNWPLGSKVIFDNDPTIYICVDRYPKLANCHDTLCTVYLFTADKSISSSPRLARVETLSGH